MMNELFILGLGALLVAMQIWCFKNLPQEKWQFLASIPRKLREDGSWSGINVTYYGVLNAIAVVLGVAILLVMQGALGVPFLFTLGMVIVILGACIPASRFMAAIVEKKKHTFTGGGAAFVGILLVPWVAWLSVWLLEKWQGVHVPVLAVLATFTVPHALGEIPGRLACISFGCCYGKPLSRMHPVIRRLFSGWNFIYFGKTKKIAYADQLDEEPIFPIQGVTCMISLLVGLVGLYLFLNGYYAAAFLTGMIGTQSWRVISEFFRADFRGFSSFTLYQRFSLIAIAYGILFTVFVPRPAASAGVVVDLAAGLNSLWHPAIILFLQAIGIAVFLFLGCSRVTRATLKFDVIKDNI